MWVPENTGFVTFQKVGVSPTLVISCLVTMQGPFWFSYNLRAVFIDGQGSYLVFQDINSGPLGYPCVALVVATPEPGPTRLTDPNRNPEDARPKPFYQIHLSNTIHFHSQIFVEAISI